MNLIRQETRPHSDDTRLIPLTQGQCALVDAADYDWLIEMRWYASKDPRVGFYAVSAPRVENDQRRLVRMHRLIMGLSLTDPRKVDHINHDTLDNRRSNLRIVTVTQNNQNMRKPRVNTSGYKGVFSSAGGRWRARIRHNGSRTHLGIFATREEAWEAYKQAALRLHGEFACLE